MCRKVFKALSWTALYVNCDWSSVVQVSDTEKGVGERDRSFLVCECGSVGKGCEDNWNLEYSTA